MTSSKVSPNLEGDPNEVSWKSLEPFLRESILPLKTVKNRHLKGDDVTWWRHSTNIKTDFSSPLKILSFDVSHDLLRSKIKITLFLTPNYDVIMGFCLGQWRHQSKDHRKLIQHAKFQKIRRSRFWGPQFSPKYCSNRFSAPLQNQYTHAPRTNVYEIFILNFISFNSRQKISFIFCMYVSECVKGCNDHAMPTA